MKHLSVMGAAACSVLALMALAATAQLGYEYKSVPVFIAERENKFVLYKDGSAWCGEIARLSAEPYPNGRATSAAATDRA